MAIKMIWLCVGIVEVVAGALCPKGSYLETAISRCTLCPAGTFGAMAGLTLASCSGQCTAGYYCPMGSTSPVQQRCGSPNYYCPQGTTTRKVVDVGYYTIGSSSVQLGLDDSMMAEPYEAKRQNLCEEGYFCVHGIRYACPAGTYGQTRGLTTKQCSGLCPPGSYCPLASTQPTPCPPGVFGTTSGLQNDKCSGLCPLANYCLTGTITPQPCPAGYWGNASGLKSKHCSTICTSSSCSLPLCPEGYYCTLGTQIPMTCGSADVYCPEGSSAPTPVSSGYYTIASQSLKSNEGDSYLTGQPMATFNLATRVNQQKCENGTYCTQGIKRRCPAGTYGITHGLATAACTALCPAGYFCPEGSSTYLDTPCLDPVVYCPLGSSTPIEVTQGYYSVLTLDGRGRTTQQICPSGSYCVRGVAHLCPAGTYGALTGLQTVACSGRCDPGYICPAGSTSNRQQACGAGTYTNNGQTCMPCRPGFWCVTASPSPIQNECGGPTVYCPLGSSTPLVVQSGYYASNANSLINQNVDFTTQIQCPVNNAVLFPQCPSITQGANSLL